MSKQGSEGSTAQEMREAPNEGNTQEEDTEVEKLTATKENVNMVFDMFNKGVPKIILIGETGTGKTWMARKICDIAAKPQSVWISLDKKHDEKSLTDTMARQFSIPTGPYAREDYGENEKREKIKHKMKEKLEDAKYEGAFVLLVLDGQLNMMETDQNAETGWNEHYIKENILGLEKGMANVDRLKVLITRSRSEDGDGDGAEGAKKLKLEPFSGEEAFKLFTEKVVSKLLYSRTYSQALEKVSETIQQNSWKPAEILMLAGTLNYFVNDNYGELNSALEVVAGGLTRLLRYVYDKEPGNPMIDCFWQCWDLLTRHGGVHYNELIASWIMEGCLNHTNHIEKAYEEGHRVLMELIRCCMLRMQEDNIVVLEGATLEMNKYCRRAYSWTADPGLASLLRDIKTKNNDEITPANVLEGITPADGMMKTLCGIGREQMISSLLIDGGRLCREIHDTFFGPKQNLSMLAIFNPRLKSIEELSISRPEKLLVLILRGSCLLENVNLVENFSALTVLELSGLTYVFKDLPDDLFVHMSQLRSLELTGTGIKSLPNSLSELTELRRLILRQCSFLKQLPRLNKLSKLEVIDLSECTSLKKIQERSFGSLEKLKVINFSHTQIAKLPFFLTLRNLTMLLLKGCSASPIEFSLKQDSSLKIVDLSGATNIKNVASDCFEGTESLRELDLSETQMQYLPPVSGDLHKLRLKGCSLLRKLPELEGHGELEELDLSGCRMLEKLPELSALQKLKILDLRDTRLYSQDLVQSLNHIEGLQILS